MITKPTTELVYRLGLPATGDVGGSQLTLVSAFPTTTEVMFYAWWRRDAYTNLADLPDFGVEIACDYQLIAKLAGLDLAEVLTRVQGGNRPYIARLEGVPVAYGWSAAGHASIGELGLEFVVPAGNRYLWDFATLPAWRGLGIYPRLLQAILACESAEAERFWIGHICGNIASQRGIVKAGFGAAGATKRADGQAVTFAARGRPERAQACAALLGLGLRHSRKFCAGGAGVTQGVPAAPA